MKKKDLLAMKKLTATKVMLKTAAENSIRTQLVKISWGTYRNESTSRYKRYFRATEQNGVLKVAMFSQKSLQFENTEPIYEIYCDKENESYITYEVSEEKWRTAKIDNLPFSGYTSMYESENWQQDSERKLVNDYFNTKQNKDIEAAVLSFQSGIKADQLNKKHRTELDEIDETMREVPSIPKIFEKWIAKNAFSETMFYEPDSICHRRWPRMYCTHCRKWMDTLSFPNRPEHNKEGECPTCGAKITYKSWNRQKYVEDDATVEMIQRLKDDTGWILRKFNCHIKRNHEKGWEEYELSVDERARARLDDNFVERELFKYGEYKCTGVTRWCHECRKNQAYYDYRYHEKTLGRAIMYTPNLKREFKREEFANVDLKKVMKGGEKERVYPVVILRKLYQHPYIEYLQKSGLTTLANEILADKEEAGLFDKSKTKINEVLKLDKQRFNRLKELDGGSRTLAALQYEKNTGNKITDENIKFMDDKNVNIEKVIEITERTGMNLQRTLNYLQKQMKVTEQGYNELFRHYEDYLNLAEIFGMDITDEIVCRQPRLMEFHDRYTARKNRAKNKTRDMEVDIKYPLIKQNVDKFKERFEFRTKEFQIVVPEIASDITKEGRKQHHCVGASDTYIKNMNDERFFIIFLRKRSNLKKPYYTLEVDWDGKIEQFYAAYDRQPDKEEIKDVLKKFTKKVQKRQKELEAKMKKVEEEGNLKTTRIGNKYVMQIERER